MITVILVAHILVSIVLIVVVLMQRSEGGALGIGGGGGGGNAGGGGLMSGRSSMSPLVRTTIIFGAIFFITSLGLTTLASRDQDGLTDIERELQGEVPGAEDLGLGDPNDVLDLDLGTVVDPLATPDTPAPTTTEPESDTAPSDPLSEPN